MSKGADTESINADPWDVAVPYMEGGFKEAQNLYNDYSPEYYSGQTQAGFSPDQLTAQQGIRDFAIKGAPSMVAMVVVDRVLQRAMHLLELLTQPTKLLHKSMDRLMVKD